MAITKNTTHQLGLNVTPASKGGKIGDHTPTRAIKPQHVIDPNKLTHPKVPAAKK